MRALPYNQEGPVIVPKHTSCIFGVHLSGVYNSLYDKDSGQETKPPLSCC